MLAPAAPRSIYFDVNCTQDKSCDGSYNSDTIACQFDSLFGYGVCQDTVKRCQYSHCGISENVATCDETCVFYHELGESCSEDAECDSYRCVANICRRNDGTCQKGVDEDCDASHMCDSKGKCSIVRCGKHNQTCDAAGDHPKCWRGACRRIDEKTCDNASDCNSLACDVFEGTCTQLGFVKDQTPECRKDDWGHVTSDLCSKICQDDTLDNVDKVCDALTCNDQYEASYCEARRDCTDSDISCY